MWVVNLDPNTVVPFPRLGPGGGGETNDALQSTDPKDNVPQFSAVFVDAMTGKFLFGLEKGNDPAGN